MLQLGDAVRYVGGYGHGGYAESPGYGLARVAIHLHLEGLHPSFDAIRACYLVPQSPGCEARGLVHGRVGMAMGWPSRKAPAISRVVIM